MPGIPSTRRYSLILGKLIPHWWCGWLFAEWKWYCHEVEWLWEMESNSGCCWIVTINTSSFAVLWWLNLEMSIKWFKIIFLLILLYLYVYVYCYAVLMLCRKTFTISFRFIIWISFSISSFFLIYRFQSMIIYQFDDNDDSSRARACLLLPTLAIARHTCDNHITPQHLRLESNGHCWVLKTPKLRNY